MHSLACSVLTLLSLTVQASPKAPPKPPSPTSAAPGASATPPKVVSGQIAAETKKVDAEIIEAETENAKYAGGLVKALIEARLGTLRQTRAMLNQRAAAADLNITITYRADGRVFVPPPDAREQVASLEGEIARKKQEIAAQKADADQYSGGLVQAMKLTTVATSESTLAMLEQRRLALKFGLPQYLGFQSGEATSTIAPARPVAPPPMVDNSWEIVAVDARVTESNSTWWKYAWKLTLKNNGTVPVALRGTIEFQDKDGFVVDDDPTDTMVVQPGSVETFTGYALVTTSVAPNIARTGAKIRRQ